MSPLVRILKQANVKSIYFCSGSRNASLEKVLKEDFTLIHHFDERKASFMALGEAKVTNQAVAICTTSGTATLECISAMAEAYYSNIPLILISADRPLRLRGSGAPQTIEQVRPFESFVRSSFDGTITELNSFSFYQYPLQLNIQIDDALIYYISKTEDAIIQDFEKFVKGSNPLFLITDGYSTSCLKELALILLQNNYYVYIEKSSNVFIEKDFPNLVRFEKDADYLVKNEYVNSIVRIGHTPLLKLWRDLDRKYVSIDIFNIDPRGFSGIGRGKLLSLKSSTDLKYLEKMITKNSSSKFSNEFTNFLPELIEKYPQSEVSFYKAITEKITEDSIVYLGNSMPIRYWELVSNKPFLTYSSRGANGIDGQIATAIGIARNTSKKVYAILGDLTTLYDLASLLDKIPSNFCLIIVNNHGGRIFELVGNNESIINEHKIKISKIISGFEVNSTSSDNSHQIDLDFNVIEIFPCLKQTRHFWNEWRKNE